MGNGEKVTSTGDLRREVLFVFPLPFPHFPSAPIPRFRAGATETRH